ncbi:hypothetical protein NMY22_g2065 [Coprinellus aureogranulatus]|nr:hypothetical protein NMY22_g2065 [Coprinellus aureogranulatus]
MVDEPSQASFGSAPATPVSALHQGPTSTPAFASSSSSSSHSASNISSSTSSSSDNDSTPTPTLIHLPSLTHLSLRTNAIPPLLTHLLLPNLTLLHLEDLNGKRPHASQETATVLRQLLVRMELPSEYRTGRGLRVLELVGVEVACAAGSGMGSGCRGREWG